MVSPEAIEKGGADWTLLGQCSLRGVLDSTATKSSLDQSPVFAVKNRISQGGCLVDGSAKRRTVGSVKVLATTGLGPTAEQLARLRIVNGKSNDVGLRVDTPRAQPFDLGQRVATAGLLQIEDSMATFRSVAAHVELIEEAPRCQGFVVPRGDYLDGPMEWIEERRSFFCGVASHVV